MPRSRTRLTHAEWAVRGLLATLALILGYFSVTFSIAQVVAKDDPVLAHRLAPYDGRVTARLAASLAGAGASNVSRLRAERYAREALRQDPTAVIAVSTLGVNALLSGDTAAAQRLFTYAQRLSRRDLQTQLWSIENAIAHGDIPEALRYYDVVLRTNTGLSEMLFPVLGSASSDPAIRKELVRTLAGKPPWGDAFIGYVADNSADPRLTAALFVDLVRANVTVTEDARVSAIRALIAGGMADQAWSYYSVSGRAGDRGRSRDPYFAAILETPSQLDWMAVGDNGLSTTIENGAFDFTAPASVGGALLQQMQLLPPGDYRLTGHSDAIEQPKMAHPYWVLMCRDGRELGRVDVPNSSQAGGNFSGTFSVPAGCPIQILTLIARPSSALSGLSGRIDRAELAPLQ